VIPGLSEAATGPLPPQVPSAGRYLGQARGVGGRWHSGGMDELMRRRVYGADHEDPAPRPRRVYRELVGGPLDGLLLDITGWTVMERAVGAPLRTEIGRYGRGGRALYGPRPGDARLWDWQGDTP
jgi:hypothetical protein